MNKSESINLASARRGSLSSLHRQPLGSFSPGTRLSCLSNSSLPANGKTNINFSKDLDRFTKHFIAKVVQIIVQSRVGVGRKLKNECKPTGNDWFNLNIVDVPEVSDKVKGVLESLSTKSNWRVCCEISLKSNDGGRVILEHWIISNKTLERLNQFTQRAHTTSNNQLTNSNNGTSPQSTSSISSLPKNTNQDQSNESMTTNTTSSIYVIYNRMSLVLKTILTTTNLAPACRLASQSSEVLCYKLYANSYSYQSACSIEDVSPDSPGRRSTSSTSSNGSINIREFVGPDDLEHFCPILRLGSIKTDMNQLDISLCYRTNMKTSDRETYNRIMDEDCITAAKQLLAGHEFDRHQRHDSIEETPQRQDPINDADLSLRPAFASEPQKTRDPNLQLIESAFDKLLERSLHHSENNTEPFQIPQRCKSSEIPSGSTPKSLTDSFVFVELNPPFASDEQNEINSFFHGPTPTFNNGYDSLQDVDDLTNQLAVIEAKAGEFDDFVDGMCLSEDESIEG